MISWAHITKQSDFQVCCAFVQVFYSKGSETYPDTSTAHISQRCTVLTHLFAQSLVQARLIACVYLADPRPQSQLVSFIKQLNRCDLGDTRQTQSLIISKLPIQRQTTASYHCHGKDQDSSRDKQSRAKQCSHLPLWQWKPFGQV